jgi:hypothetical protein
MCPLRADIHSCLISSCLFYMTCRRGHPVCLLLKRDHQDNSFLSVRSKRHSLFSSVSFSAISAIDVVNGGRQGVVSARIPFYFFCRA